MLRLYGFGLGWGKKFFGVEVARFCLRFGRRFGFLYGVSGSVFAVLRCASMLVSVTFNVVMRDD